MAGSDKAYGKPTARTRLFSFAALGAFAAALGWIGKEGYLAATDAFVAPVILSPESDAVLTTKLHATQLEAERAKTAAEVERVDAELAAGATAIARLEALTSTGKDPRAWYGQVQANAASANAMERAQLDRQAAHLKAVLREQEALVAQSKSNLDANVISKADHTREVLALSQVRLALFDAERARVHAQLDAAQARLTRAALAGDGPAMPELLTRDEQRTRLELELVRLTADARGRRAERATLVDKLAKLDELETQLRERPLYRATKERIEAAFVPYTQLDGVGRGAPVYDCVWGAVRCKRVGTVAEVVPGEVVLPDPWGHPMRGQYALLDLANHAAARAKVLRVRATGKAAPEKAHDKGGAVTLR